MTYGQIKQMLIDILPGVLKPYDDENKKAIYTIAERVTGLEKTIKQWSGGLAVILIGLVLFEALFNGACNSKHLAVIDGQAQTTTATDKSIPAK